MLPLEQQNFWRQDTRPIIGKVSSFLTLICTKNKSNFLWYLNEKGQNLKIDWFFFLCFLIVFYALVRNVPASWACKVRGKKYVVTTQKLTTANEMWTKKYVWTLKNNVSATEILLAGGYKLKADCLQHIINLCFISQGEICTLSNWQYIGLNKISICWNEILSERVESRWNYQPYCKE